MLSHTSGQSSMSDLDLDLDDYIEVLVNKVDDSLSHDDAHFTSSVLVSNSNSCIGKKEKNAIVVTLRPKSDQQCDIGLPYHTTSKQRPSVGSSNLEQDSSTASSSRVGPRDTPIREPSAYRSTDIPTFFSTTNKAYTSPDVCFGEERLSSSCPAPGIGEFDVKGLWVDQLKSDDHVETPVSSCRRRITLPSVHDNNNHKDEGKVNSNTNRSRSRSYSFTDFQIGQNQLNTDFCRHYSGSGKSTHSGQKFSKYKNVYTKSFLDNKYLLSAFSSENKNEFLKHGKGTSQPSLSLRSETHPSELFDNINNRQCAPEESVKSITSESKGGLLQNRLCEAQMSVKNEGNLFDTELCASRQKDPQLTSERELSDDEQLAPAQLSVQKTTEGELFDNEPFTLAQRSPKITSEEGLFDDESLSVPARHSPKERSDVDLFDDEQSIPTQHSLKETCEGKVFDDKHFTIAQQSPKEPNAVESVDHEQCAQCSPKRVNDGEFLKFDNEKYAPQPQLPQQKIIQREFFENEQLVLPLLSKKISANDHGQYRAQLSQKEMSHETFEFKEEVSSPYFSTLSVENVTLSNVLAQHSAEKVVPAETLSRNEPQETVYSDVSGFERNLSATGALLTFPSPTNSPSQKVLLQPTVENTPISVISSPLCSLEKVPDKRKNNSQVSSPVESEYKKLKLFTEEDYQVMGLVSTPPVGNGLKEEPVRSQSTGYNCEIEKLECVEAYQSPEIVQSNDGDVTESDHITPDSIVKTISREFSKVHAPETEIARHQDLIEMKQYESERRSPSDEDTMVVTSKDDGTTERMISQGNDPGIEIQVRHNCQTEGTFKLSQIFDSNPKNTGHDAEEPVVDHPDYIGLVQKEKETTSDGDFVPTLGEDVFVATFQKGESDNSVVPQNPDQTSKEIKIHHSDSIEESNVKECEHSYEKTSIESNVKESEHPCKITSVAGSVSVVVQEEHSEHIVPSSSSNEADPVICSDVSLYCAHEDTATQLNKDPHADHHRVFQWTSTSVQHELKSHDDHGTVPRPSKLTPLARLVPSYRSLRVGLSKKQKVAHLHKQGNRKM